MHQTSGVPEYVGLLEAQGLPSSAHRTTEDRALQTLVSVPNREFPLVVRGSSTRIRNQPLRGEIVVLKSPGYLWRSSVPR